MAKSQTLSRTSGKKLKVKSIGGSSENQSLPSTVDKEVYENCIASVGSDAFKILFGEINNPVMIIQESRIVYINAKGWEKFGYSVEKTIGQKVEFLIKKRVEKAMHDMTMKGYYQVLSGDSLSAQTIPVIAENGESVPVQPRTAIIEYNHQPALLVVLRDLTEQDLLEQQSSKTLTSLFKVVNSSAGNLKNSLQSISNAHYYVKKELEDKKVYFKNYRTLTNMLETVKSSVERADHIIQDLVESLDPKSHTKDEECSE